MSKKHNKKKLADIKPPTETLTTVSEEKVKEKKPHVGITYLDKNKYGLSDFVKVVRGDKNYLTALEAFLEKCRQYESMTELVKNHQPHGKSAKNEDDVSETKINAIATLYNIETGEMYHLHILRDGKGEFVIHGFIIDNVFEIVWLDCKHEVHKSK